MTYFVYDHCFSILMSLKMLTLYVAIYDKNIKELFKIIVHNLEAISSFMLTIKRELECTDWSGAFSCDAILSAR